MEYNSQREYLTLPEYGRNIQKMVQEALQIENRDERTAAAYTIVNVMAINTPGIKDMDDFHHKLWDHLYYISNYALDVDCPYPIPEKRKENEKPDRLSYPQQNIKYRHYGKILENLIDKASLMEDPDMKDRFVEVLANLMKRQYLTWNRDSVNDDLIKDNLEEMSEGAIEFKDTYRLTSTNDILGQNKKKPVQQQHQKNNNNKNNKKKFKQNKNFGKYNKNNNQKPY